MTKRQFKWTCVPSSTRIGLHSEEHVAVFPPLMSSLQGKEMQNKHTQCPHLVYFKSGDSLRQDWSLTRVASCKLYRPIDAFHPNKTLFSTVLCHGNGPCRCLLGFKCVHPVTRRWKQSLVQTTAKYEIGIQKFTGRKNCPYICLACDPPNK